MVADMVELDKLKRGVQKNLLRKKETKMVETRSSFTELKYYV